MKKAFLTKTVTAVIAASTIATLAPLGVSAATINQLNLSNYNTQISKILSNSNVYTSNGQVVNYNAIQSGLIKINGQTYNFSSNGQTKVPTVATTNNNQGSTTTSNNTGSTAGTTTSSNNTGSTTTSSNTGTTTSTGTTANTGTTTSTTSIDVQGLPKLPSNYSVTVQAAAEQKILDLMNAKRTEAGLKPLSINNTLVQVARYKSNDMIQNNFFDHTNPDGTKWTNWLQALGYKYTAAGENIAYNTYDPVKLFDQWWNSAGHRANMMNSSYTKVGIGVVYGNGKYMGTQEFSN